jgi:hypothetical protein
MIPDCPRCGHKVNCHRVVGLFQIIMCLACEEGVCPDSTDEEAQTILAMMFAYQMSVNHHRIGV